MDALYEVVKASHILLIVTWLGMDTGVFVSSYWIANPKYSVETRVQFGRLLGILDMGPRTSLILILTLGLIMSVWRWGLFAGLGDLAPIVTGVLVVLLLLWLWGVWQQYLVRQALTRGQQMGWRLYFAKQFTGHDLVLRLTLAAVLIVAGVGSLVPGLTLFTQFPWLDIKVAMFGAIILCGAGIRFASADFEHAFVEVIRQGTSPEREHRIALSLARTRPWVIALWSYIVIITYIAVAKSGIPALLGPTTAPGAIVLPEPTAIALIAVLVLVIAAAWLTSRNASVPTPQPTTA